MRAVLCNRDRLKAGSGNAKSPVTEDIAQIEQETPAASLADQNGQPEGAVASAHSMIVFDGVTKIYEPNVAALSDVSFVIDKGEFVFVVGASGS